MKSTAKQGIKNSSPNEFASTMNRLYAPLCFAANRFLNDKSASEDIVQEAFARLWELVSKEKEIESIDNYMYMLVHNLSLEWLRKLKLQPFAQRSEHFQCYSRNRCRFTDHQGNRKITSP